LLRSTAGDAVSPTIALIFTGGTMEAVGSDRLDLTGYSFTGARASGDEILARLPELAEIADVTEIPWRRIPSMALTDADWLDLLGTIHGLEGEHDGVVVAHGTNTLEETAYFLHLSLKSSLPVVLAGAMRPFTALSGDGDLNLANAVAVASDGAARSRGVLVLLNDTIHCARDVTKASTYRVNAFESRDTGPLGYADSDRRVVFYREPARAHTVATEFDPRGLDRLPRVDIAVSYVGADGVPIDAAVAAGAKGIVLAATGAGLPTPAEEQALARARDAGVAVCLASRVGSGRVVRTPRRAESGYVAADNLLPWKARVLLSLALTVTQDPDEIQLMFDRY
jgi:L-asparaginase